MSITCSATVESILSEFLYTKSPQIFDAHC
jgi:hypothetical protein